jgi:hypothetical protein
VEIGAQLSVPPVRIVPVSGGLTMESVLVAAMAFAGGGIGSVLTFVGVRAAAREDVTARRQEEWGRRFTFALEAYTSADVTRRRVGRRLLVELSSSDLASPQDRRVAWALVLAGATSPFGGDLSADVDATTLRHLRLVTEWTPPDDEEDPT